METVKTHVVLVTELKDKPHLHRTLQQLDGELKDLNEARASSDKKTAAAAESSTPP